MAFPDLFSSPYICNFVRCVNAEAPGQGRSCWATRACAGAPQGSLGGNARGLLKWVWYDDMWTYNVLEGCWVRPPTPNMMRPTGSLRKWPDEKPKYYLQGRDKVRLLTLAMRVSPEVADIICNFLPRWKHHIGFLAFCFFGEPRCDEIWGTPLATTWDVL